MIRNILAVFQFEWKRALTPARMAWWFLLAAFPVFIIGLVRFIAIHQPIPPRGDSELANESWRMLCVWLIFALIPMLVSMLGTLLWTSPAIAAELERRSWVYLATRPHGAESVLLGKYLAAVTWVIPPAILGLSVAVPLAQTGDSWRIWWTMVRLVCLSCPAFAAIYLLLGVVLPKRAMVICVGYTLLFELLISFVPAVINKITVQYRLRALVIEWCQLTLPRGSESTAISLIGNESPSTHIGALLTLIVILVGLAVALLRSSEFSSASESDN